ncbi:hypothetical protein PMAYCL1PPCAC_01141, partial [Pristionchus mayeri]
SRSLLAPTLRPSIGTARFAATAEGTLATTERIGEARSLFSRSLAYPDSDLQRKAPSSPPNEGEESLLTLSSRC